MAYLDNNNDDLYPKGDPLGELDRELEELRMALGAMEDGSPAPDDSEKEVAADSAVTVPETVDEGPAAEEEAPLSDGGQAVSKDTDEKESKKETDDMKHKPARYAASGKGKNKKKAKKRSPLRKLLIILLVLIVLAAGSVTAVKLFAPKSSFPYRFLAGVYHSVFPSSDTESAATEPKTVVFNDSEMGDVHIEAVEGAELNTLTKKNFVTDKNGFPAYYDGDQKISHLGADLSEFQGDVDFEKMKAAGVEFVMLRIGGRSYGNDGTLYGDSAFDGNYEKAKAAGLKVGAYFFSQATSTDDAKEEASFALSKLGSKKLDYPLAFDWENIAEDTARTDNVTGNELTAIAEAFCDTVTDAGYKSIVYSNTQQMFVMYDFETMKDYDFWLADYRDFPNMYYKFDMWQYTKEGAIDGVNGTVDLNLSFTDFS